MKKSLTLAAAVIVTFFTIESAQAGAPFNNLKGVGGVAFNPLAYTASTPNHGADAPPDGSVLGEIGKYVSKPRFGAWYVNLSDVGVNWFATGAATTIAERLEVSYGYESIGQKDAKTHTIHNIGSKLLVIPENFNGWGYVPAVSVGGIYQYTDNVLPSASHEGWDGYVVATKLITALPRPLLISGGALLTDSYATGAFGYDKKDAKVVGFANADLILTDHIIVGAEFRQGPDFGSFKNAEYWDAHLAYAVTKDLTLIAAYVNAGRTDSTKETGLGNGVVLSVQYAF